MNFTTDIFFAAKPAKKLYGVSGLSEIYIETIYLLVISFWLETDHWTLSGPNVLNDSSWIVDFYFKTTAIQQGREKRQISEKSAAQGKQFYKTFILPISI